MKYCGREFSGCELDFIRNAASEPGITRRELSRQICKKFRWLKPDGGLKDMSCRVALLRMAKDGVIQLQPVKPRGNNFQPIEKTPATDPKPPILRSAGKLQNIRLELVTTKNSRLWNEYIDRYHYLGHKTLQIGRASCRERVYVLV